MNLASSFFMKKTYSSPLVIGATGGSGTRAVAKILMLSQKVYLGNNHNRALDCLDFKPFYDHHVPDILSELYSSQPVSDSEKSEFESLRKLFCECFDNYIEGLDHRDLHSAWGWKGPRSMFFLPFFDSIFPKMKFIHVVRDGRDMAYSLNQNQLHLYGDLSLDQKDIRRAQPIKAIALWEKVNISVSKYAINHLRERYMCIKYEDLVFDSENTLKKLADFLEIEAAALQAYKGLLKASSRSGSWREEEPDEVNEVVKRGSEGLYYFGYLA